MHAFQTRMKLTDNKQNAISVVRLVPLLTAVRGGTRSAVPTDAIVIVAP